LRVAYNWEQDKLVRLHWGVMDRTLSTPPLRQELLDRVENVEVRFLDTAGQWHLEWPPLDRRGPQSLTLRPRAVEFSIELEDYGRVTRLVETSG
jgi:type II secretion system protein J